MDPHNSAYFQASGSLWGAIELCLAACGKTPVVPDFFLVLAEYLYLKTGDELYERINKFWSLIFALAFGMGVVSGLVMSFEFGTNFSRFAQAVGPVRRVRQDEFTVRVHESTAFSVLNGANDPSGDFYQNLLARGMKPAMARLTLARRWRRLG